MKLNIFYVDDEQDLCDIFEELNHSDRLNIKTYVDPVAAVADALKDPPDLVFMDYRLPGMTGDKVAVAMKTNAPVYLISGDLNVKTDFNFTRIIGKPVDNSEIKKIISELLEIKKGRSE